MSGEGMSLSVGIGEAEEYEWVSVVNVSLAMVVRSMGWLSGRSVKPCVLEAEVVYACGSKCKRDVRDAFT
jgi:hypothetical protein